MSSGCYHDGSTFGWGGMGWDLDFTRHQAQTSGRSAGAICTVYELLHEDDDTLGRWFIIIVVMIVIHLSRLGQNGSGAPTEDPGDLAEAQQAHDTAAATWSSPRRDGCQVCLSECTVRTCMVM